MDFPGLSQLLLNLVPTLTTADLLYFSALFDLDGDGLVGADDIMDAFEEAGTTLTVLQTQAHKVRLQLTQYYCRVDYTNMTIWFQSIHASLVHSHPHSGPCSCIQAPD